MGRPFQFRLRTILLLMPFVGVASLLALHAPVFLVSISYLSVVVFAAWAMDGISPPTGLWISFTLALSLVLLLACLFVLSL